MRIKPKPNFKIDEIALVLVVAVIAVIASIYREKPAKMEAEKITSAIMDRHDVSFASNGIVDEGKLKEIQAMDYNDFKKSLNAKNDFCVYIEDGNGNILLAKGSSKLSRDGLACTG